MSVHKEFPLSLDTCHRDVDLSRVEKGEELAVAAEDAPHGDLPPDEARQDLGAEVLGT